MQCSAQAYLTAAQDAWYKPMFANEQLMAELERNVIKRGQFSKHDTTVAYSLLQLAKLPGETGSAVRSCARVLRMVDVLKRSTEAGAKSLTVAFSQWESDAEGANGLAANRASATKSLMHAQAEMRPPGVRDHDNDKENYRDICIIPTPRELNCTEAPFIPDKGL